MLVNVLIQVAALVSFAHAVAIPVSIRDGLSSTYLNERGFEIHQGLARRDPESYTADIIQSRQLSSQGTIFCGCGIKLDTAHCNDAVSGMASYVDANPIKANAAVLVSVGDVVAFVCNFGTSTQTLTSKTFLTFVQQDISSVCGSFIAGTSDFSRLAVGYMTYAGENTEQICGKSETSKSLAAFNSGNSTKLIC